MILNKNEKGMIFASTVLLVMLLTFAVLLMMFPPSFSSVKETQKYENYISNDVEYRNNLERVYAKIHENISINNNIIYEDISKIYNINELKNEKIERKIREKTFGEKIEKNIEINNKTDIIVNILDEEPINEYDTWDYIVSVYYDGVLIKSEENKNLKIDSKVIYNEDDGVFNYGTYKIIIEPYNAILDFEIKHDKIKERIIEVGNDDHVFVFSINNIDKKEVYYINEKKEEKI